MKLEVLFEDKHVIVVIKPPKIPSQSDKTNDLDMMKILKVHITNSDHGVREPYLGLIHRLDRPVGGIMVFAKTKFSNSALCEEIRQKKFKKVYYAVVCGTPQKNEDELKDYLLKLSTINMSKVTDKNNKNAKEAILRYKVLDSQNRDEYGELSLLEIELKTGRHHQIRVQLSNAGFPIWGDNKYNKAFVKRKDWTQIALWAGKLSFTHPKDKKVMEFESKPDGYPFEIF